MQSPIPSRSGDRHEEPDAGGLDASGRPRLSAPHLYPLLHQTPRELHLHPIRPFGQDSAISQAETAPLTPRISTFCFTNPWVVPVGAGQIPGAKRQGGPLRIRSWSIYPAATQSSVVPVIKVLFFGVAGRTAEPGVKIRCHSFPLGAMSYTMTQRQRQRQTSRPKCQIIPNYSKMTPPINVNRHCVQETGAHIKTVGCIAKSD